MPMTSANATTLKVKSAISDMSDDDGPHGSLEVASRTYTSPEEGQRGLFVDISVFISSTYRCFSPSTNLNINVSPNSSQHIKAPSHQQHFMESEDHLKYLDLRFRIVVHNILHLPA